VALGMGHEERRVLLRGNGGLWDSIKSGCEAADFTRGRKMAD